MTMPPAPPGPGAPSGDAARPGTAPQFQYRPHDPYATFAAPTGPVLPPPPTWAQRWGLLPEDDRPRQVTVILQALWVHFAVNALAVIVAALAAVLDFSVTGLFGGIVSGLVAAAVNLVLIWAIVRERLGRFGLQDPRRVCHIGLGALALNALIGAFGLLKFVPAVVELAALALCLVLLYTRPARAWLRDRPGNRPRVPEQRPDLNVAAPAPPVWREAAPVQRPAPPTAPPSTMPPPTAPPGPPRPPY